MNRLHELRFGITVWKYPYWLADITKYAKVSGQNPECIFPNRYIPNAIFTETDKSWKTYPENQLPNGYFPNNIFQFSFGFSQFVFVFFRFFLDFRWFFSFFNDFFVFSSVQFARVRFIIREMSFPLGYWFLRYVFRDLSVSVKGRFGKYPFVDTLSVICPGIYANEITHVHP